MTSGGPSHPRASSERAGNPARAGETRLHDWPGDDRPLRDPAVALSGSTFNAGIRLLPKGLQLDARRLYHLLRTLDDLVDERDPRAAARVQAVERWARGEAADTPETRTLERLSVSYPLSHRAVAEFCLGMRQDLAEESLDTEQDLELYCQRVGGTVGVMLSALLGTRTPVGETRMATLGTAMQLTNILRDIDDDLARGRVYVPRETIDRFGFPHPEAREELLRYLIARADALYEEGLEAIPQLVRGRRAMLVSSVLYREILRQIERRGFGRRAGMVTVPVWRRRLLVALTR